MWLLFLFVRVYPFFAIAFCVPTVQLARFYRNKNSKIQWVFWIALVLLALSAVAWVVARGDLHSDEWVKSRLMIS